MGGYKSTEGGGRRLGNYDELITSLLCVRLFAAFFIGPRNNTVLSLLTDVTVKNQWFSVHTLGMKVFMTWFIGGRQLKILA